MKSTPKQDTFTYRISYEELFFLLNTLELNTLPGLGSNPFGTLSVAQKGQMLAAGFNSLRAKGWAQLLPDEEHPLGLDRLIVLPLLVCASSRKVLSVIRQSPDRISEKLLVFRSPELFVMYRPIEVGIYEFIVTADHKDLSMFLVDIINLGKVGNAAKSEYIEAFLVSYGEAKALMELQTKKDVVGIRDLLKNKDVPKRIIENYISTLEKLQHSVIVSFMGFSEHAKSADDFQGRNITVLVSPDNVWAIESNSNENLEFRCVKAQYFLGIFSEWVGD